MNAKKLFSCLVVAFVATCSLLIVGCVSEAPKVQRVTIVEMSNVTATSIDCQVSVNPNGASAVIERGVLYDTRDWTGEKVIKYSGNEDNFTVKIDGLLPGSIYCVRGYARTEQGVAYSNISTAFTPIIQGSVTDIENNTYKTIRIGKQEWMVENLRTTKFNDGSALANPVPAGPWISNTSGAYVVYTGKGAEIPTRGYLYNGSAAIKKDTKDNSLLAPEGWRVPSIEDWEIFHDHLVLHAYGTTDDENAVGIALAANEKWTQSILPGTIGSDLAANNKTGFNALPAGARPRTGSSTANFRDDTKAAYFWSSSAAKPVGTTDPIFHFAKLSYDEGRLILDDATFYSTVPGAAHRASGFSVRCMRDAQ